ncbi:MAG: hypothetical protein RJB66_1640 [Pseudomonadota bacterium]|jgi:predicted ATPase/two-component sensor histidine kinase
MNFIPNYTLLETLGEGPQSTVFKGYYKNMPHRLLVVKSLKTGLLTESQRKYFRQKVEHLKVLNDPRLLIPLSFQDQWDVPFITREYFAGITLDEWAKNQSKLTLDDFLTIACTLAELLEKIHQAGLIHGGIKPHNILIDPQTLDLRIVDFITPLDVRNVSHFIYDRQFVEGTLAYTSPEQTGRINHRVEFTTDIYSLGIIFYELLTKKLPFFSNDPLELIHSHLAEEAPLVTELNSDVPLILSKVIEKLLLKQPEKRYQGGRGLLMDLLRFRTEYHKNPSEVKPFPLGLEDRTHRITFISKMVGRDSEADVILSEYSSVSEGQFRALFISGFSGIGKTRLIQELQKPIVRNKGYFTSGKFDVYQKNIPYSSIIQAFRNLTRTFLTESDERVEVWKNKILEAVGKNGRVLTDVLPELQILIGPQPEVMALPPVEARNRFLDVFGRFLSAIANAESPLVLFIDDLQWCDIASFELLTNVFANFKEHPYLFLLGAYRHNEVDSSHALVKMVNGIQESRGPLKEIRLGPILDEHTHEMVSYILDAPIDQTQTLAQFISKLTEGNPLFVSESLSFLYNENLLYFKEASNEFSWNMDKIRGSNMPSTVVALFTSKVKKLPTPTIDLLEYCACMGNLFTPDEVAHVREISLLDTFEVLKPALGQGLLIENKDQLQFVHDKVQEAALSNIDRERRQKIHWEIGHHLYESIPKDFPLEKLENIFTVTSHLNIATQLMEEAGGKPEPSVASLISHLNYSAGNSALNSLATEAANDYFKRSLALLPDKAWTTQYEKTFRVFQKLAKTELMVGNYESSERLLDQLLDYSQSDLDKTEALAEQTTSLSSIGNFIKAIATANRGLAFIGKEIPEDPETARSRCEQLMNQIHKDHGDVWGRILTMPFTDERKSKIELSFYSELIPDLYMSGLVSQLYLSAAQSTQHCLSGGMDESVIYSFSIMGLNLGENEHFEEAFKYEDLAKQLSEKYPNTFGATRGINGVVWCNMHSRSHPDEIVNYCLKGIQSGRNCGDLYNAGLCYGPLMWNLQVRGAPLSEQELYARECLQFSQKFHLSFSVGLAEAVQLGWIEPMKNGGKFAPMGDRIKKWVDANHIASAGSYYVHSALARFYLGDHLGAETDLNLVEKYMHGLTDNVLKREWYVFRVINTLRLAMNGTASKEQEKVKTFIEPFVKKLETWANIGPLLRPYLAFLKAEQKRFFDGPQASLVFYQEAICIARALNYGFLEGYLHQTLGTVLTDLNLEAVAKLHFLEAYRIFQVSHVSPMAMSLVEKYPQFFENEKLQTSVPVELVSERQGAPALPSLDVEYFLKYSHAIAAEIQTEQLLKKIMNVVIELSGAQFGCLVMDNAGELWINAESQIKEKESVITKKVSLADASHVCRSMIRYVHRTKENIILTNACEEGPFKDNQEVQSLKLKSVFCLPFSKQNKLIGILYLENRLSDSVFSPKQVELIRLLSTQAAISIENARLVEDMKRAEHQITSSLREKEVLLKEIHHRVKNNLQVISSLFNLQSRTIKDAEALRALRESQNRVKSMAFVHEKLHQAKDLARIDVGDYLKHLCVNLAKSFGGDATKQAIQMNVEACDIPLSVDVAIPVGLIVNEIVSNCYKHAFPDGRSGKVDVSLQKEHSSLRLTVRDNGVGFPENIDFEKTTSLGLQLIMSLVTQVQGQIELSQESGSVFNIIIPISGSTMAA